MSARVDEVRGAPGQVAPAAGGPSGCSSATTPGVSTPRVGYGGRPLGRRHHLPPARLLGAHRFGRAERSDRVRPGTQRLYGFRDILALKVVKRLLDTGVSLQQIRGAFMSCVNAASRPRRDHPDERWWCRVYECTSTEGGHRPFSPVARACSASRSAGSGARSRESRQLPSERPEDETPVAVPGDELRASAAGQDGCRPRPPAPRSQTRHRPSGDPPLRQGTGYLLVRAAHPAWERPASPSRVCCRRRRGKLPGTSQAPGPRAGTSGASPARQKGRSCSDLACQSRPRRPDSFPTPFTARHIAGPRDHDVADMLSTIGLSSLDEFASAVPDAIRSADALDIEGRRASTSSSRSCGDCRPQQGPHLNDRSGLHGTIVPGHRPQCAGESRVVHRVHALSARDQPGTTRGAAPSRRSSPTSRADRGGFVPAR